MTTTTGGDDDNDYDYDKEQEEGNDSTPTCTPSVCEGGMNIISQQFTDDLKKRGRPQI